MYVCMYVTINLLTMVIINKLIFIVIVVVVV